MRSPRHAVVVPDLRFLLKPLLFATVACIVIVWSIHTAYSATPTQSLLSTRSTTAPRPAGNDLVFASYIGGEGIDEVYATTTDRDGNMYAVGRTYSTDFPTTPGVIQESCYAGCLRSDGFIIKLSPDGTQALFSTYLGHGEQDEIYAIAVDDAGFIYVTGHTKSPNFPTTPGAYERLCHGCDDAFITKLTPNASTIVYSTFLGGDDLDSGSAIEVSADGTVYVTGGTWSSDFPTTPGAYDTTFVGTRTDTFVTHLNADGSDLVYSTFLGGDGFDDGSDIVLLANGEVAIVGTTTAPDYPTTANAYDTTLGGYSDLFVSRLSSAGDELLYSTYLGGADQDYASGIGRDSSGAVMVAGIAASSDYPTTPNAYQTAFAGGNYDAVITKFTPDGTDLVYSTYLGGSATESDYGVGFDVNRDGEAYIVGLTYSEDYPVTDNAVQPIFAGFKDAYLSKLSADGSDLVYSTYLGGSVNDWSNGLSVDEQGIAYMSGWTESADFPVTDGAFDTSCGCSGLADDGFVAKIVPGAVLPPLTPTPSATIAPTTTASATPTMVTTTPTATMTPTTTITPTPPSSTATPTVSATVNTQVPTTATSTSIPSVTPSSTVTATPPTAQNILYLPLISHTR